MVLASPVVSQGSPVEESRPSPPKEYLVSEVLSGDRFRISSGAVVRYASLEAPDLMSSKKSVENMARESMEFNRKLVEGKTVRLEFGNQIRDPRGEYLAFVFLEDGSFVNRRLLGEGYAKVRIEPPNLEYADELRRVARRARAEKRGLWRYEPKEAAVMERWIGDVMKKEFHEPGCELLQHVPRAHQKVFLSQVDAKAERFRFCHRCKTLSTQETELF